MSQRARIMVARLLLIGAAVFVVFTVAVIAQDGSSTMPVPSDPSLEPGALDKPPIPELTEEERLQAIQLATSSSATIAGAATVPTLFPNGSYEVEKVGVWHTSKGLQKIGASVVIRLSEPSTLKGTLPRADYDDFERSFPPYSATTYDAHYVKVERLIVMIDLNTQQVVEIAPGPEAVRATS